jgi:tetratricopeptide (TPR) repeat protein
MVKACSSCGTTAAAEARFCRLCGAPLRSAGDGQDHISPLAQTVPLSGEGRPTDGFTGGDQKRSAETSRVRREEIEHLLRRPHPEHAHEEDDAGPIIIPVAQPYAAPVTNELERPAPRDEEERVVPPVPVLRAPAPKREVRRAPRRNKLPLLLAIAAVVLVSIAAAAFFLLRQRGSSQGAAVANSTPPPNASPSGSLDEQLNEAEALLASGQTEVALTRLRALVQREPQSERAHRLLGAALEGSGARRESIDEYRAATRLDERDTAAWRALASAQFSEELYADAVESYRRLVALTGEEGLDDNARLEYADALRLAGYTDDARQVYRKVEATAPADLARRATAHLSELTPSATPRPTASPESSRNADTLAGETRADNTRSRTAEAVGSPALASVSPAVSAQPSPSPQAPPAVSSAGSGVAQTDPDAYYFQALSIVGGRPPESLPKPLLLRALQLFQNAAGAKGGTHREQAQRYAERLGREYDRRQRGK